jgi:RecB family endonuclease NucS
VQVEQASAVKQEQYCQLHKEQKMTNENYVMPILNVESAKNSINISLTSLKEHQNDAVTVNQMPQYKNS